MSKLMLEVGKFYKTRDGKRIIKIVAESDLKNFYGLYLMESEEWESKLWSYNGGFLGSAPKDSPYDLVEEVPAPKSFDKKSRDKA